MHCCVGVLLYLLRFKTSPYISFTYKGDLGSDIMNEIV